MQSQTVNNLQIEVTQDRDAESPREWDNVALLSLHHRRYRLAEECGIDTRQYPNWGAIRKALERKYGKYAIIIPVYMYDHSGLALRAGSDFSEYGGWDSGQIGYAVIPAGKARKEFGRNWRERAEKCLHGELETYQAYLNGEVYSYVITDPATGDRLDSCSGFYGYGEAESAAKEFIASLEK